MADDLKRRPTWPAGHDGRRKVGLGATVPNDSLLDTAEIRIEDYFSPEGRLRERII